MIIIAKGSCEDGKIGKMRNEKNGEMEDGKTKEWNNERWGNEMVKELKYGGE